MKPTPEFKHARTIGVLNIISGIVIIIYSICHLILEAIGDMMFSQSIPSDILLQDLLLVALGVFVIITGVLAKNKMAWVVVLIGSICAIPTILGILSLILISRPTWAKSSYIQQTKTMKWTAMAALIVVILVVSFGIGILCYLFSRP
jgi:hypothetical protein